MILKRSIQNPSFESSGFMVSDKMNRPILISIIAILYGLEAIVLMAFGILIIIGGAVSDVGIEDLGMVGGIIMIIMGLITLAIAIGFWQGWTIIWYLAVIFGIISIIFNIISLLGLFEIITLIVLIIQALILFYMFTNDVKDHFDI